MRWPMMCGTKTGWILALGVVAAATFALNVQDASAYTFDTLDGQTCAAERLHVPSSPNLMVFADSSASMRVPVNAGPGTVATQTIDIFSQGSSDEGLIVEPAGAAGNPRNQPGISLSKKTVIPPYAWVANNTSNTVSKFNMKTLQEEGRYWVGDNPSRTAVDLDGNAWITTRNDGWVTKILWNSEECPDQNGNGTIETSSGTNVLGQGRDECVVYQIQPKPVYTAGNYTNSTIHTLRGVAAGPDGRVWIGYSNHHGGIQSIEKCVTCPGGHKLGEFYPAKNIPQYTQQSDGVFRQNGSTKMDGGHSYGLVLDAQGMLYYVSWSWDRFLAFDTITKKWKAAYYTPGTNWQYGIALDAEGRIWMGSYPNGSGVKMFDPKVSKVYYYPHSYGVVTGLGVEPGTGDVWASFYSKGVTGRLRLTNPNDVTQHTWSLIPTTKVDGVSSANLSGVGNDLRGVGFDIDGYAWTMGTGSDRIFKLDPKTNRRHADLPIGKSVGSGQHYTYSDFTGSTALSFTAPSGKWGEIYQIGGKQVLSITVDANVPAGTNVGVRYRGLDANGIVISPWSPAVVGGSENYTQFPTNSGLPANQQKLKIMIPQTNDNPFVVDKIQLEVRLSTSDKGVRPYLYGVSMDINPAQQMFEDVQNVAADLSASFGVPGGCTEADGTGCDTVRVGLSYFSDGITQITVPGEDTGGAISTGVADAATGGTTGIHQVAEALLNNAVLKDASRSNFGLIVTDGKFNTLQQVSDAVKGLCEARKRTAAPVMTYVMGPGTISDMTMNSLLAAAGGTGMCCEGSHATCTGKKQFDPCDWVNNSGKLTGALEQTGTSPYTQVVMRTTSAGLTCFGAMATTEVTAFKTSLADLSREQGCTFALNIPDDPGMYNNPNYPQTGALAEPDATKIRINHKDWNLVNVPYCKPGMEDCGFADNLAQVGVGSNEREKFADEGWYFVDDNKRNLVRLTDGLCGQIAAGRVYNSRSQIACQCSLQGQACSVPGQLGRCAVGVYACDEGQVNVCKQIHRPMPETCNGLDDDCDGSIDNLATTSQNVPKIPAEYAVLECLQRDACVCPSGPQVGYLGVGATAADELAKYLDQTSKAETGCYCAAGLEAQQLPVNAPSQNESSQNETLQNPLVKADNTSGNQAAACAVAEGFASGGSGESALVVALAGAAVWWRRRRN